MVSCIIADRRHFRALVTSVFARHLFSQNRIVTGFYLYGIFPENALVFLDANPPKIKNGARDV